MMSLRRILTPALLILACSPAFGQVAPASYPPPAEVRSAFLGMLDRPKVDPDPQVREISREDGLVTDKGSIATEKKPDGSTERMPLLLVRPESTSGRLPAVIVLHGTGGNKEGQKALLIELARKGIIGVAIDARYHGDRSGGAKGAEAYNAAIIRAWRAKPGEPQEHPFYYDTCWDLWRLTDYLSSRPDVDPARLGMIGFSMGGIETWLAASVDERIKVAIPAISVQSFRWSLDHDQWQGRARTIAAAHSAAAKDLGEPEVNRAVCRAVWDKVVPGILGQFDCPSMLRLFAGRPLLILNGDQDPNCPIGGAEAAFSSARASYDKAGTPDLLKIDVARGVGHAVTPSQKAEALDWLVKYLKP